MRKFYITMVLSLVCAMGLHADDELYGVMLDDTPILKLYYDNERAQRGGSTDWKTEFKNEAQIVSMDESIQYIPARYDLTDINFDNFSELIYIENLGYWPFMNVYSEMFQNCAKLKWVDMSTCTHDEVGATLYMFDGCSSLETIYCDVDYSNDEIRFYWDMFKGCTSLVGGQGTTYDENHVDLEWARPDGGASAPGYFTPSSERIVCGLITSCEFQGMNWSALKPNVVWTDELNKSILDAIQPVSADVHYAVNNGDLLRYDEEKEDYHSVEVGTALEEGGLYRLNFSIRTEKPAYKHGQRFPHGSEGEEVAITLNGNTCEMTGINIYEDYSDCFASFEFTLAREGVEKVQGNKVQGTKVLRNGQLLIERNGKMFNALGAEL